MSLFSEFLARLGLTQHDRKNENPDLVILEERVLYSAGPMALDTVDQAGTEVELLEAPEVEDLSFDQIDLKFNQFSTALDSLFIEPNDSRKLLTPISNELVVIDTSVENYEQLVDDLLQSADASRRFELVLLDSNSHGVDQLTNLLSSRKGIDALHIVSHGSDGSLQLGAGSLNAGNLENFEDDISEWKYSLSRNADIYFYGCEVAETEIGESFLEQISVLTESDIAASRDVTGHSTQGGDWDFEFQVGRLENFGAFSLEAQSNWTGQLLQYEGLSESGVAKSLAVDGAGNQFIAITVNSSQTNGDDIVVSGLTSGGSEIFTPFIANTTTVGDQKWASVAVSSAADRLVVVWTTDDLGGNLGVFASLFDTSGNLVKSEFQIDSPGTDGNDASVAMSDDGSFIVTWEGSGVADADGIYARRYDVSGNSLDTNPFSVNDGIETVGLQSNADVAVNTGGDFVIVWDNYQDADTANEIFYRYYNSSGVAQFDGATGVDSTQVYLDPSVDMANNGSFVLAYTSDSTTTQKAILAGGVGAAATALDTGVVAKSYDQFGSLEITYSASDTTLGSQSDVTAVTFDNHDVVFSWHGEGVAGTGTYYSSFDRFGTQLSSEALLIPNIVYNSSTDVSSPERGAPILDPNDPGYTVWNQLASGVIAESGSNSVIGGIAGAGYVNGQLVEGYHLSNGLSLGDQAPTIDPAPVDVDLDRASANGTIVFDVDATDADGTTLVYSIVGGDPGSVFAVDSDGVIAVADDASLSSTTTYQLVVAVTDDNGAGLSVAKTVNVTLTGLEAEDVNAGLTEDQVYRFTSSDFADSSGDTVTRVQIASLPTNGTLLLNGLEVTLGQVVLMTDVNLSGLAFVPFNHFSGAASFDFLIGDNAGFAAENASVNFTIAPDADSNLLALGDRLESLDGAQLVNETSNGTQGDSHVAALAGGGYVVVWQSKDNDFTDGNQGTLVYQQIYAADGSKIGFETRVDTDLTGDQLTPNVIGLKDGGYLVTWVREISGQYDIYAQRYDQNGNEVGIDGTGGGANSEFEVTQDNVSSQSGPKAAALSDGGFVIVNWGSPAADSDTGVFARIFDAKGNAEDEFLVNDTTLGAQRDVSVSALANNRFVIGWVDQAANGFDVVGKVFDAGDPGSGSEFTINTQTPNRQNELELAALPNGQFVAIWQADASQDGGGRGVFGQLFDSTGGKVGGEFLINQITANHQWNGDVVGLPDGGFLAVYQSTGVDGDGDGVFGRRFDSAGLAVGDEFQLNGYQFGNQTEPDVTLLVDGTVVVTWLSADGDDLGADFSTGVFVDRFEFATSGDEDQPISLGLASLLADNDGGEEFQRITIKGIPAGATISDGGGNVSTLGNASVDVQTWDLAGITISSGANQHDDFTLQVEVVTHETANSDTQTTIQNLQVLVNPVIDPIVKNDWSANTDEDSTLEISVNDLTDGVVVTDTPTVNVAPGTSFDQTTLPPRTVGPNLVWDNVGSTGTITFDSGVGFTSNTGSAIAGLQNALVLDGSAGGQIQNSHLAGLFQNSGGIELWIQPDAVSGQHVLFEWGDSSGGIALYQDGDEILLKIHSPAVENGFTTEPYTLVGQGLQAGEFNQIYFMISAGATTTLGDKGATPDVQLYLNGQLVDELVDIPGYNSSLDFTALNVDAGLGKRVGAATGEGGSETNFEGMIAKLEIYDDLTSSDEVESRYWLARSTPGVVEIDGQAYTPGSSVTLASTARLHINADGSLTYDSNGAFESLNSGQSGNDSFTYKLQNGNGQFDDVVVSIQVDGVDAIAPVDLSNGVEINADGNDVYFLAQNGGVLGGLDELTFEVLFSSDSNTDTPLISYQTTDQPDGAVYFDDFSILYQSDGTLDVYLPGNGGTPTIASLSGIDYSTLMNGGLHNLGFSWDNTSGDWKVYVDGVVTDQGTAAAVGQTLATGGELVFGQEQDEPNGSFDSSTVFQGTYHDIRIWDHQRLDREISESHSNKFHPTSAPSGLLANWQFDSLSGGTSVADIINPANALELNHAAGAGFTAASAVASLQVVENVADGAQVGFVVPTDQDGESGYTFNLADDAGGRFVLDTNTGQITVADGSLLNYEAGTSHDITVDVTDTDGGQYQEVITIEILDVNEQAVIATNTGISVTQGVLGNVITNSMLNEGDPDSQDSGAEITYTLIAKPGHGDLRLGSTVLNDGDTFTQADIDASNLFFDHTHTHDIDDSFDFTVEDGLENGVVASSGTFNIGVTVDNLPTSNTKTISLTEDTTYTVVESDFAFVDLDGDTFTEILVVKAPVNGQLFANGILIADNDTISIADIQGNRLIFVPTPNEFGTAYASFEFQVRASNGAYQTGADIITFDVANDGADLVVDDDSYVTDEDTSLVRDAANGVLGNDLADSGTFQVIDYSQPNNGSVAVNSDGSFSYTPDPNFHGSDSFEYAVTTGTDGLVHHWGLSGDAVDSVGGNNGIVNGPTTIDGDFGNGLSFDEQDDFVQIPDVTYTDDFTLTFKFRVGSNSGNGYQYLYSHGTVTLPNSLNIYIGDSSVWPEQNDFVTSLHDSNDSLFRFDDLSFDAVPFIDGNWHTYTLTLSDAAGAKVYMDGVLMASSNHGTTGVLNPAGDLILGYRNDNPSNRYFGGDLDTLQLYDRTLTPTEVTALNAPAAMSATVNITVDPVNDVPVVYDNVYGVEIGGSETFQIDRGLLYNSLDVDGDSLTISLQSGPTNGTLGLGLDGTFTYSHDGSATTSDSFTYQVSDGNGGFATATVQIHIDGQGLEGGSEFLVNQDSASQPIGNEQDTDQTDRFGSSSVAANSNGDYVVVWRSIGLDGRSDMMMRMYDFSGRAISNQIEVSQASAEDHLGGVIAMDDAGNFVVVWTSFDGTGEADVYARRYDASGNPVGNEFRVTDDFNGAMVDDFDFGDQVNPAVSMNSSGDFVVVWDGARFTSGSTVSHDIYLRKFAADGTSGDVVVVNDQDAGSESVATVVLTDSGDSHVFWNDANQIHGRTVQANGVLNAEIQVPTGADVLDTRDPSVATNSSGLLAISYQIQVDDGVGGSQWETQLQIIDPTNVVWHSRENANQFQTDDQMATDVSFADDGSLIMTWHGQSTSDPADTQDVFGRRFRVESDGSGNPFAQAISDDFLVSQSTGAQTGASVASLDSENFIVVWTGQDSGGSRGIFARQYGNQSAFNLDGSVLEDVNGDAQLFDSIGVSGATVKIYREDGVVGMSSGDRFIAEGLTDASGNYTFDGLHADTNYWVVVDSKTVATAEALNSGYLSDDLWAEQTYGDGAAKFGGLTAGVSDDASNLLTSEHVSQVALVRSNASNVDFGFSFNVVTNSLGGGAQDDDVASNQRSVQGSLRQFITNANSIDIANAMRFVPTQTADRVNGADETWEVLVAVALPSLTDDGTSIDGRAYLTDGITRYNASASTHGFSGVVGVGSDGIEGTGDEDVLVQLDAAELEISDVAGIANGLYIEASDSEVRDIAIHGFGILGSETGNIHVAGSSVSNVHIHHNMIGSRSHDFVAPNTAASQSYNILIANADQGVIENNLIGFASYAGIKITGESNLTDGANNWVIRDNEIKSNGSNAQWLDGIDLNYDTRGTVIQGNLIANNNGYGIDTWNGLGEITISNNTVTGNGGTSGDMGGIRLFGSNNIVEHNIIANNAGSGVHVVGENGSGTTNSAATGNLISQNAIYGNSTLGIDLSGQSGSATILSEGDGFSLNGVANDLNAGNLGFDYPELTEAFFGAGQLFVAFEATSTFEKVEIYSTNPADLTLAGGKEFGQGSIYLGSLLATDLAINTKNGTYYGVVTIPTGLLSTLTVSSKISAIAIDSNNNTSEFGSMTQVKLGVPVPTAVNSSVTAVEDNAYTFAVDDFEFSDISHSVYHSIRIETLPANGMLTLNNVAVNVNSVILATDIQSGLLVYVAAGDQNGVAYDTFEFSVNDGTSDSNNQAVLTIDVTPVNDQPVINLPVRYFTPENQTTVGVIDGQDIDGDTLHYTIQGGNDAGLFSIDNNNGQLTFRNAPDYETPTDWGSDNQYDLVVRVDDGNGGTTDQLIEVLVTPVNDNDPSLVDNRITITEGTNTVQIALFDQDLPGDVISVALDGGNDAGLFAFDPITRWLSFNQTPDYENPHDADADGRYEIQFRIDDNNGRFVTETLIIRVVDDGAAPIASDDSYTLNEGESLTAGTVLANDNYSTNVNVTLVESPGYGNVTINSDGSFAYVHGGAEVHSTHFVYQVSDDSGFVDTGMVILNINPVDDAPVAVRDSLFVIGDLPTDITFETFGNDFDVDSTIDSVRIVSQPSNGSVFIDSDGSLVFVPDEGFEGSTSFEYEIGSLGQLSSTVAVIEVAPPPAITSQPGTNEEENTEPDSEQESVVDPEQNPEGGTAPTGSEGSESEDIVVGTPFARGNGNSDSLADIRNAGPVKSEIDDINLDSIRSLSVATYVYASDIETIDSGSAARQQGNRLAVSQFSSELLAARFVDELDAVQDQFFTQFDITMPSLAMAGTSFLTVGYLAWMVRGGVLLTTFMSSIPAWRMLDPLAVLESAAMDDGADDDQSIGQLVDR